MTEEKRFTRIDLAFDPEAGGVWKHSWYEGWKEGDYADQDDFLPDRKLMPLLFQGEQKGWSVTQFDADHARLLKGEIVRIDFTEAKNCVMVAMYPYGWTAKTRPIKQETRAISLDEALSAYQAENSGYAVRRWEGGARVWKGAMLPVRESSSILRMRREYSQRPEELTRLSRGIIRIDFAFDL